MSVARALWRNGWAQAGLAALLFAVALAIIWWRGPEWGVVLDAFRFVAWSWIALAFLLNVVSTVFRALSWRMTLGQALPPGIRPRLAHVLSSFGVGLFANAVVPGRLGELARVATLRRHLPDAPSGTSAALVGTVFAHRLFDLVPASLLVVWVLLTANVPHWAVVAVLVGAGIGFALFTVAWLGARRHHRPVVSEGLGTVRYLLAMARQGLSVLKAPLPLAGAVVLQCLGWAMQLLAVYAAMRAFGIHAPLPAAGLVLLLMNVATIVPLWPGNVGLTQAAVALPLLDYGVAYGTGFAYGLALQAVEIGCGVGLGVAALAREGISFAMLRRLPEEGPEAEAEAAASPELEREARAREGTPVPR